MNLKEIFEQIQKNFFYHGTASGNLRKASYGIHVGTFQAAKEALEARIGIRADGKNWDGTQKYGETLLAGRKSIESNKFGKYKDTGFNSKLPDNDFFPKNYKIRAQYSNSENVDFNSKPIILKVEIIGPMTNTIYSPMSDEKANSIMSRLIKMKKAKRGYFYKNISEDYGSISAVVPNEKHLKIIK
jgi:hypothetical protein